jgi:hypothetical protein
VLIALMAALYPLVSTLRARLESTQATHAVMPPYPLAPDPHLAEIEA